MPKVHVDEDTVQRLDNLRVDEESYDEIINELINIYEAEELTLFHGDDYSSD
jgi:aminoglycoside phosphotransferase